MKSISALTRAFLACIAHPRTRFRRYKTFQPITTPEPSPTTGKKGHFDDSAVALTSSSGSQKKTEQRHGAGLHNEALTLATQLAGKTFLIPDLHKIFAAWPIKANPEMERLRVLVDEMLERIITDERKLKALKKADFGQLMA